MIGHHLTPIGRDLVDERPDLPIRCLQAPDQDVRPLTDTVCRGGRRLDERIAGVLDHHDRVGGAHPVVRVDLPILRCPKVDALAEIADAILSADRLDRIVQPGLQARSTLQDQRRLLDRRAGRGGDLEVVRLDPRLQQHDELDRVPADLGGDRSNLRRRRDHRHATRARR